MNAGFNSSTIPQISPSPLKPFAGQGSLGKPGVEFDKALVGQVGSSSSLDSPKGIVGAMIDGVDGKQKVELESRRAFLAGESNNLHQTMIAGQEASIAFTLMVEMRNKVMEAYQELMRIQI